MHYTLAYLSYNGLNTSFLSKNNNKKTHTTYSQNAQHTCTTPIFSISKRTAHMSCVIQCTKLTYSVSQCIPMGSPSHGGNVTVYIWHKPTKLAHPFLSVLVAISVFMALSTVLHLINSPDNSPFSHSVLVVLSLPYWSFQLYISFWKSPSALTN